MKKSIFTPGNHREHAEFREAAGQVSAHGRQRPRPLRPLRQAGQGKHARHHGNESVRRDVQEQHCQVNATTLISSS